MSIIRVRSGAGGANDGTSWVDAFTTFQAALTAWTIADEIWWADDSTETFASVTTTFTSPPSTNFIPVPVYRMTTGDVYSPTPKDDTDVAQIILTGNFWTLNLNFNFVFNGVRIDCDKHISIGTSDTSKFIGCDISIAKGAGSSNLDVNNGMDSTFINCRLRASTNTGTGNNVQMQNAGIVRFEGCTFPGFQVLATGLFQPNNGLDGTSLIAENCDFSTVLNSFILVDTSDFSGTADDEVFDFTFYKCQLHTSYTLDDGVLFAVKNAIVKAIRCRTSSDDNINEKKMWNGFVDESTSTYYTVNGFIDSEESVNVAQQIATDSDVSVTSPIAAFDVLAVLENLSAQTLDIEMLENFTTALTKRECYAEISYIDSATLAYGVVDTSTREFAAASYADLDSGVGTSAWTNPPAGSRSVRFRLAVIPARSGFARIRIYLGKYEAGKVLLINPAPIIS